MDFKARGRPSEGVALGGLASAHTYLPAPIIVAVGIASGPVDWGYGLAGLACLAVLTVLNIRDLIAIRRSDWDHFQPWPALLELILATAAIGFALAAMTDRAADFGPMLLLPVATAAVVGDRWFISTIWAACVATLTVVLAAQGLEASVVTRNVMVEGAVWGGMAILIDFVVKEHRAFVSASDGLAALASVGSEVTSWPGDLASSADLVLAAVDVESFALFTVDAAGGRVELLRWPGRWQTDAQSLVDAAHAAQEGQVVLSPSGDLAGVRAASSSTDLTLVVPARTPRNTPTEHQRMHAVVSVLVLMADRASRLQGLVDQAMTDPLTGLANRRLLYEELDRQIARASRSGEPLSVAILDFDHFKRFNDRYGHATGDELLRQVARLLDERTRRMDLVARFGGEEFAVVLPGVTLADARGALDSLRRVARGVGGDDPVTFSAGVAQWAADEDVDGLLRRADAALYRAKEGGRDRVEPAPPPVG